MFIARTPFSFVFFLSFCLFFASCCVVCAVSHIINKPAASSLPRSSKRKQESMAAPNMGPTDTFSKGAVSQFCTHSMG
ncbi:hypothetical protein J3F83DRAFT_754048 [Trichoderma novae-zelandiae]